MLPVSAFPTPEDFYRVLPEVVWCGFGTLIVLLQPFVKNRHFFTFLALTGTIIGTGLVAGRWGVSWRGILWTDSVGRLQRIFPPVGWPGAFLVVLAAGPYLYRENLEFPEFYALLLFATAGMGVLAGAQELFTAFVGLEMSSIASYVLAGYRRDSLKSGESAMKYFLLGSFATAFFLYGIALVYGATGTTMLVQMGNADANSNLLKLGLAMILIGLGFKVAAAPFQIWTPDVYEGAPTPVTALFSAGPKAAAFALMLRIFATVPAATHLWFWAFWILAVLTMFAGNLGALVQTNIKRLLAYSSIAHAGYILVAFAAVTYMTPELSGGAGPAYAAILFYILSYSLVKIGAFTIVSQIGGTGEKHLSIDDYAGLGQRQPWVAATLSVFLLSLLGLPVTAGFFGKLYIFKAAVESHLIWLAVIMAVNSIIGAFYYFRIIVLMYMRDTSAEIAALPLVRFPLTVIIVLVVTFSSTLYLGLFPSKVLQFILQPTLIGGLH